MSFSLAGDHGLPINRLYFRVTFTSTDCPADRNQTWNTIKLRKDFRARVLQARNDLLLLSNTELIDLSFYNDAILKATMETASLTTALSLPSSITTVCTEYAVINESILDVLLTDIYLDILNFVALCRQLEILWTTIAFRKASSSAIPTRRNAIANLPLFDKSGRMLSVDIFS